MKPRSRLKTAFRIATLFVPSALAWGVAFWCSDSSDPAYVTILGLGPLWVLLVAALLLRSVGAYRAKQPALQLDILTGSGSALAWSSALAIALAVRLGWASLAVVGLLGTGLFHVVVLYMLAAARGRDPMRAASIKRRFVPQTVTEGESVIEELHFCGARIPVGLRLLVASRIGPRWATSRHVLEATESGAEVVLESDLGAALRGEHDAAPMEVWLQDVFGVCRSKRLCTAPAHLTVLPRVVTAENANGLLERGDGPRPPRPASRLPTEGCFRLREYQHGDDVRRIHWVRSVASREIIVRLPDELPPDQPQVRLVLDTFFPEACGLAGDAPADLLDSMVRCWLAIGLALAERGTRVTLATAARRGRSVAAHRQPLSSRTLGAALRLGARVEWQNQMVVDSQTDETTFVVSRGVPKDQPVAEKARWIIVPHTNAAEPGWAGQAAATMPYPAGSADNRWSRRRRENERLAAARRDHAFALAAMHTNRMLGGLVAIPGERGFRLEVSPGGDVGGRIRNYVHRRAGLVGPSGEQP